MDSRAPQTKDPGTSLPAFRSWLAAGAVSLLAVVVLWGRPVPAGNEFFYLLRLHQAWHPHYLAFDWTLAGGSPEHFLFNNLFGLLTLVFSLEVAGWIGRLLAWPVLVALLLRLGKTFGIGPWGAAAAILAWLGFGQSLVSESWIFQAFEAKCIAYIFLLATLLLVDRERETLAGLCAGLTFSFHPAIGMWGGLAAAACLPALRVPWSRVARFGALAALGALPGIVAVAPIAFGESSSGAADWKHMALFETHVHIDPFSWVKRNLLALVLMFAFNIVHFLRNRERRSVCLAFTFQSATALFFIGGVALRALEMYAPLRFTPFRLFPLLTPLFFMFAVVDTLRVTKERRRLPALAAVLCVAALLAAPNPFGGFIDASTTTYRTWTRADDDLHRALEWVSVNTPDDATLIVPPWRPENQYVGQRGIVVSAHFFRRDRLREWRERLHAVGGTSRKGPGRPAAMREHFESLDVTRIEEIRRRFGGDYLVTRARLPLAEVHRAGEYHVYQLGDDSRTLHDSPEGGTVLRP